MEEKCELFRFRVWHPTHGETEVVASSRYFAVTAAAKEWGVRWTTMARDCIVTELGKAPARKIRKEKRNGKADKKKS